MAAKRSLPIAGQKPAPPPGTVPPPDDPDERPPWHWTLIGTGFVFLVWLPLAAIGNGLAGHAVEVLARGDEGRAQALASRAILFVGVVGFAIAALTGGLLVGRFGARAGVRQATLAGVIAPVIAWLLTAASVGFLTSLPALGPLVAIGALAAWAGGRWGLRLRPKPGA